MAKNLPTRFVFVWRSAWVRFLPTLLYLLVQMADNRTTAAQETYTYDAANRLIQVQYGDEAVIAYTYDAAGNRTQQKVIGLDNPNADCDGNGLPDLWEYRFFGTNGVSPAGDPDTDGLSNTNELAIGSSPILKNTDGDPMDDNAEWIADTNPTNALSYFQLTAISASPPIRVYFPSSPNRVYTLQSTASLTPTGWTNVPGQARIAGSGTVGFLIDTNFTPQRFYRVRVERP